MDFKFLNFLLREKEEVGKGDLLKQLHNYIKKIELSICITLLFLGKTCRAGRASLYILRDVRSIIIQTIV